MRSLTRLPRSLAATIAALTFTLWACSRAVLAPGDAACVLGPVDGDLVRLGGTVVLLDARWNGWEEDRLTLSLPARWTIRPVDAIELGVFDANGLERARTGTHAQFDAMTQSGPPLPLVIDGALVVCPT